MYNFFEIKVIPLRNSLKVNINVLKTAMQAYMKRENIPTSNFSPTFKFSNHSGKFLLVKCELSVEGIEDVQFCLLLFLN